MARVQETKSLPGKNADAAYGAAETVFVAAGYQLIKRRPMAWLLTARGQRSGGAIEASFGARPGGGAAITLSLSSDELDEMSLQAEAESLLRALGA